jgi:excisionase family DNA binding protein
VKIHVRFKGGKTETLTTLNPKPGGEQVKTPAKIVELVDQLLDDHVYSEIAEILDERGFRPGGSVRPGRSDARFTAKRVQFLVHRYGLRWRYDRLRERGMLTKKEIAARLGIHEATVVAWAKHGLIKAHRSNGHYLLYEDPGPHPPIKQCSRWN